MTKEQIIQSALNFWFRNAIEITTLDLKNFLRKHYPGEQWSQQYVSKFLYQQGLDFYTKTNAHGDAYRVYSAPKVLTSTVLLDQIDILESVNEPITKTKLKTLVRNLDYPLGNFKEVFDSLGLKHNDRYTSDNHKIWYVEKSGQHYSKSKNKSVAIKTMAKPHLKNALCKTNYKIQDILDNPLSEQYEMLEAYFLYDIRKIVE